MAGTNIARLELAMKRIRNVLRTHGAASARILENKISDAGPTNQRPTHRAFRWVGNHRFQRLTFRSTEGPECPPLQRAQGWGSQCSSSSTRTHHATGAPRHFNRAGCCSLTSRVPHVSRFSKRGIPPSSRMPLGTFVWVRSIVPGRSGVRKRNPTVPAPLPCRRRRPREHGP